MTNVNARREILKNSSCCYSCLKTGHVSKKCTKNYICRICSKKQHIIICEEMNKQSPDQSPNTAVNLNNEKSSKNVLLQSAVLQIENIDNSNYCTDGEVLFDTGSQRSFLTESVRKKLKLPTSRKETIIFQVFGQNDDKVKEVDIVQIKIKGYNGLCIFIEAISCPKIFSSIRNQKYHFAKNNYDHLRNIKLLKHSEGDSTFIDLLIGNDFYYSFINGNIVKGQKDEPSLQKLFLVVLFYQLFLFIKILTKKVQLILIPHMHYV